MKRILLILAALALGATTVQAQVRFETGSTDSVRKKALESGKLVFIDLYATWCGPCKMMAPAVEKLAEEYEGRAVIGKLDVEESMDIAGRYGVMNVPTLILFKDGRAVERKVGLQSASDLRKLLDSVL